MLDVADQYSERHSSAEQEMRLKSPSRGLCYLGQLTEHPNHHPTDGAALQKLSRAQALSDPISAEFCHCCLKLNLASAPPCSCPQQLCNKSTTHIAVKSPARLNNSALLLRIGAQLAGRILKTWVMLTIHKTVVAHHNACGLKLYLCVHDGQTQTYSPCGPRKCE